jgi:hypothetical protein
MHEAALVDETVGSITGKQERTVEVDDARGLRD